MVIKSRQQQQMAEEMDKQGGGQMAEEMALNEQIPPALSQASAVNTDPSATAVNTDPSDDTSTLASSDTDTSQSSTSNQPMG